MDIKSLRNEIDNIDKQILHLFIKRMNCVKNIYKFKSQNDIPIFCPNREKEIISKTFKSSNEYSNQAALLFSNIINLSRIFQQNESFNMNDFIYKPTIITDNIATLPKNDIIACHGSKGSFSSHVAKDLFRTGTVYYCKTFKDICSAIKNGTAKFGVLPIENEFASLIDENYELLANNNLFIIDTVTVKLKTGSISPNSNNKHIVKFKDQVIDKTKFAIITNEFILPNNANKIMVRFSTSNTTSDLNKIITNLILANMNISKIESKNLCYKNYVYIEFTGNIQKTKVAQCISSLNYSFNDFSFLGNYIETELTLQN